MQFQPFRMEYLRGDRMFVDALSRPPSSNVNAISLEDIEHAQPLDPYLQSLRKAKASPSPLIFRNNAFFHLDGRLYVPLAKREEVLISCHDQAGHFGLQHTHAEPFIGQGYTRIQRTMSPLAINANKQNLLDLRQNFHFAVWTHLRSFSVTDYI